MCGLQNKLMFGTDSMPLHSMSTTPLRTITGMKQVALMVRVALRIAVRIPVQKALPMVVAKEEPKQLCMVVLILLLIRWQKVVLKGNRLQDKVH